MERIQYITGLDQYEGLSLREISRRTGHHFNTIKKYIDRDNWNEEIKPRKPRGSKLDPLKPIIDEWLKNDLKMPRKQRHTGTKIYELLKTDDRYKDRLLVGKQTVINYVTKTKRELCKSVYDTAILAYHDFGEAQVDFGDVYAYNSVPSNKQLEYQAFSQMVNNKFYECKQRYGAIKLQRVIESEGTKCSIKRVQRHMVNLGLRSIVVKKYKPQSSKNEIPEKVNILNQNFEANTINQKWCTDITYIHVLKEGWTYLASVMDLYSRKIIGYAYGVAMTAELALKAFED